MLDMSLVAIIANVKKNNTITVIGIPLEDLASYFGINKNSTEEDVEVAAVLMIEDSYNYDASMAKLDSFY